MSKQKVASKPTAEEVPTKHWADHVAEDLIAKNAGRDNFVCASGISPSGMVHIGNFREAITVDFVARALRDRGKKVRSYHSWDDYDAFRKVPANLPNPEALEKDLRKPISKVTDPFGCCASYAKHFENCFEKELDELGVRPEFIYQNEMYRKCAYAPGIKDAKNNEPLIREALDKFRSEKLPDDWTSVSLFCRTCSRDTTVVTKYEAPNTFHYRCKACKKDDVVDITKDEGAKLLWRVDWPMRWARENVDFEPGGKDHSSQGGSFDTGCDIIRKVWKKEPPHYVQYDFVLAKGLGSKLSSSSGNLITVSEALKIYEPAVIRWIVASRKPNLDFSIAFDLDVMKAYDDFDRSERYAYGLEAGEEKKVSYEKRIYEFSTIEPIKQYGSMPAQFPFRHLCNILQIYEGDIEKAKAYYHNLPGFDAKRFESRAKRAWTWITTFAPEDFRFKIQDNPTHKSVYPEALKALVGLLDSGKMTEDELASKTFEIMKSKGIEPKKFFEDMYTLLVGKKQGPKLASFLLTIGPKRAKSILEKGL